MERGVPPAGTEFVCQQFQLRDGSFGERALLFLECGIAEIDPAAKRAVRTGRASVVHLKGAAITRYRFGIRQAGFEKNLGLEGTQEQRVAIFVESAAAAGSIALWRRGCDRRIDLRIDGPQSFPQIGVHGVNISGIMKFCMSQASTLTTPFAEDISGYADGGCRAIELWLTKLEQHLTTESIDTTRQRLSDRGIEPIAAAYHGGLLLSQGEARRLAFDHYKRRLELCQQLGIPVMLLVADFAQQPDASMLGRAITSLAQAAQWAAGFDIRIGLEFRGGDAFCTNLETALLLLEQCGEPNVGVCLDLFHFYKGPSKSEDLERLTLANLAHVQLCDVPGVPREFMTDSDRVFPGEGDFHFSPIVQTLKRIGYQGGVAVELMNPTIWQAKPSQVAELGMTALSRCFELPSPTSHR